MKRNRLAKPGLGAYVSGFVLSLLLTVVAYSTVQQHSYSGNPLTIMLLGLAILQVVVQLFFFLHMGSETRPRWKLLMLFLMIIFAMIVMVGSIWIMYSLNYRMTPHTVNTYMSDQASSGY